MPLTPLADADLDLVLPWRNAPAVRQAMYTHHEISPGEHRAWFQRLQQDPRARWFLYRDPAGLPQGVVYFTALDPAQATAFWGFYARPDASPGTGTRMEYEALELAFGELSLHKLSCEVLATNCALVNRQKKVGFTEEGRFREQHLDGQRRIDVIRLGLLAREWQSHRQRLRARVANLDALAARRPLHVHRRSILILSEADSWINPHVEDLIMDWCELGHDLRWAHSNEGLTGADFCFCLGYGRLIPSTIRMLYLHTLVVHESDLPRGKGWSPLSWQILEGRNRIAVTLIEAAERADSGIIYAQRWLEFRGHELVDDLRAAQAAATIDLCRWFVDQYPESLAEAREQSGDETFYPRRRPPDSRLDPQKTIAAQFDLLRVVDDHRYPAFFEHKGHCYQVTIRNAPSPSA